MKKVIFRFTVKILILSIFSTLVLPQNVYSFAWRNLQEPQDQGVLILGTERSGLAVRVDGKFVGFTPIPELVLSSGTHKITVRNPYRANWLDQDWFADVRISPGDTLRVRPIFKKSFSINSTPFGASVFVQNRKIGETPVFFMLEEDEVGFLTLTKDGFVETTFTIGETEQRFFNITLKPQKQPIDLTVVSTDFEYDKKPISKKYFYSALGLAVISGALALYFRSEGNSNFDRYLETGNPELMDKYFNKAEKFDRFAAVSFGTFQVSFIMSFYLFLKQANR